MAYNELWGASITPFDENDEIDFLVFKDILKMYEKSHSGIVIAGSTGEGQSLLKEERRKILEFTLNNFDGKTIMGIKNGSLLEVMEELSNYEDLSPYAYLISLPGYYKAPDEGIYRYFDKILTTFKNRNFILYNIPSRTGSMLSTKVLERLIEKHKNLIALKDSSLNLEFVKKASQICPLYCGSDDLTLEYLKNGACGYISVASIFFSESFHDLFVEFQNGFHDLILYGYIRYVTNVLSQKVNPIGIKELFKLKGFKSTNLRLPLCEYDEIERKRLYKIMPAHETKIEREE